MAKIVYFRTSLFFEEEKLNSLDAQNNEENFVYQQHKKLMMDASPEQQQLLEDLLSSPETAFYSPISRGTTPGTTRFYSPMSSEGEMKSRNKPQPLSISSDGAIEDDSNVDETVNSPRSTEFSLVQQDIAAVRIAMERDGVRPVLVTEGSSGSYFVSASAGGPYKGIFKPRDEEPYGPHNPKLGKRIQRMICPCCHGRSCLVLNAGYTSEASASLVDFHLKLNIVPETIVTSFTSPVFNYRGVETAMAKMKMRSLPRKVGSFQRFVHGYQSASRLPQTAFAELLNNEGFIDQFQRLTVLDFIIRNTDRGLDNFLIKMDGDSEGPRIAAIDNGLAFPHKHPDHVRVYPYGWMVLPQASVKYTKRLADALLLRLQSQQWRRKLMVALEGVWQQDSRFRDNTFRQQMAVMRGQMQNLIEALQKGMSPSELVAMPPLVIYEEMESGALVSTFHAKLACCKCW